MKCRNMKDDSIVWFGRAKKVYFTRNTPTNDSGWYVREMYLPNANNVNYPVGAVVKWTFQLKSPTDASGVRMRVMYSFNQSKTYYARPVEGLQTIVSDPLPAMNMFGSIDLWDNDKINYVKDKVPYFVEIAKIDEAPNYVDGTDAVAVGLTQRLSVIKGELWYQINHGLPLLEKHTSAAVFDATICDIVTSHPQIAAIKSFTSNIQNHTYSFNGVFLTTANEELRLSDTYSV